MLGRRVWRRCTVRGCGWVGGNRGLQSRPVPGCDTKHVEQQCPARRDRDFTSPVPCTRAPHPPPPPLVRVPMMRPAAPHPSSGTRTPRVRLGERGANEGQRKRSRFLAAWTRVVATVANRVEAMGETAVGIVVMMTMAKVFASRTAFPNNPRACGRSRGGVWPHTERERGVRHTKWVRERRVERSMVS